MSKSGKKTGTVCLLFELPTSRSHTLPKLHTYSVHARTRASVHGLYRCLCIVWSGVLEPVNYVLLPFLVAGAASFVALALCGGDRRGPRHHAGPPPLNLDTDPLFWVFRHMETNLEMIKVLPVLTHVVERVRDGMSMVHVWPVAVVHVWPVAVVNV